MRLDETIEHSPESWLFSDTEKLSLILRQKNYQAGFKSSRTSLSHNVDGSS